MDNWKRMTADEYLEFSAHRSDTLTCPYPTLVKLLGEPHKNGEDDYPDDDGMTDVCWGFQRGDDKIQIWNYKNGPVYEGIPIEKVNSFSVGHTSPEAWRAFHLDMLRDWFRIQSEERENALSNSAASGAKPGRKQSMPEYCNECCGEIYTVEERDALLKSFEEAHRDGAERFGLDWLKANELAAAAARELNLDPSTRKLKALLSVACFNILTEFERRKEPVNA